MEVSGKHDHVFSAKIFYKTQEEFELVQKEFNKVSNANFHEANSFTDITEENNYIILKRDQILGEKLSCVDFVSILNSSNSIIQIFYEIVQIVMHFHMQDIVLGSVNPENIYLNKSGKPILGDFGFSFFSKCKSV
jgi:serine/threonine protein kinase